MYMLTGKETNKHKTTQNMKMKHTWKTTAPALRGVTATSRVRREWIKIFFSENADVNVNKYLTQKQRPFEIN